MQRKLKVGNAQAFWGDSPSGPATLLKQQPDLDFLTLDYLAELSLSIMAIQKEKNPETGFAADFLDVVNSLIPFWKQGGKTKIVTNAGGLNPQACARECAKLLRNSGLHLKIGIISGDDVFHILKSNPNDPLYQNLETGVSLSSIQSTLEAANAYLGAKPIVDALNQGAQIVITGRVADPSLTVGPCIHHFSWSFEDYDRIASATVAGHLIECGTQVTGGMSTNWLSLPELSDMGFPYIEMEASGDFIITKPACSGGAVNIETVKEQLLYEIGDPSLYLSPDATVSFLSLEVKNVGTNQVQVTGAKGSPPPTTLKVSAAYRDGYRAEGMVALYGINVCEKAACCGDIILRRLNKVGFSPKKSLIECIGCGDVVPGITHGKCTIPGECMLRISVCDDRKEAVERFTKELASLVTCGPQGVTGYSSGRPSVRQVFGFWPCLIESTKVSTQVEILEVSL